MDIWVAWVGEGQDCGGRSADWSALMDSQGGISWGVPDSNDLVGLRQTR